MKFFKTPVKTLVILLTLLCSSVQAHAELFVIMNPASDVDSLSADTVKRIYLSKIKRIPNSSVIAFPIDQSENSETRALFNQRIIGMNAADLRAYWAKRIFTGKGGPPKAVSSDADVVALVRNNRNCIGYISGGHVPRGVLVVLRLN